MGWANLSLDLVHLGQKEHFALLFMPDHEEYFAFVIQNDHILRYLDLFIFITLIDLPTLLSNKSCHECIHYCLFRSVCHLFSFFF